MHVTGIFVYGDESTLVRKLVLWGTQSFPQSSRRRSKSNEMQRSFSRMQGLLASSLRLHTSLHVWEKFFTDPDAQTHAIGKIGLSIYVFQSASA